jgi:hypothetical protein
MSGARDDEASEPADENQFGAFSAPTGQSNAEAVIRSLSGQATA